MFTVKKVMQKSRLDKVTFYKFDALDSDSDSTVNLEIMGPHDWELETEIQVGTQLDIDDVKRATKKTKFGRVYNNVTAKARYVTILGILDSETQEIVPQRPLWEKRIWEYQDGESIHQAPGESFTQAIERLSNQKLKKPAQVDDELREQEMIWREQKGNNLPF